VKDHVQIIIEEKLKGVNVTLTTVHHLYVVIQAVVLCSWMPQLTARAFQFQQKSFDSVRFDSRYQIDFCDLIRQCDKFAACRLTLIFK